MAVAGEDKGVIKNGKTDDICTEKGYREEVP